MKRNLFNRPIPSPAEPVEAKPLPPPEPDKHTDRAIDLGARIMNGRWASDLQIRNEDLNRMRERTQREMYMTQYNPPLDRQWINQ